ncbi:MAG TPA: efflux RND transporter periplasmic adaptor subunit [Thermoanaerobaculaceae bacterium]|nr:efflux RND transporter periplasmic adaptor subunit [Thermoanaerobaculaceae bacterium]
MRYVSFLVSDAAPRVARIGRRHPAVPLLLIATLVVAGFACGKRGAKQGEGAAGAHAVTAVTVTPRDVPVSFEFVAQTQSSRQVNIQARVSGFLERRVYVEGSMVKEGQVLFLMDTKPFQAQLDRDAAALAKQEAGLEVARATLERTKPLTEKNALSKKDLDDATGNFHASEAAVEEAKARLETSKLNLSYCTIVSPVTGITSAAVQQDGTYISPMNSLLTTVAMLSPMWVNFSMSENEVQGYREEAARGTLRAPRDGNYIVEVILVDGSLFPHTGRITFAAPSYSAETGTFMLRASVENPDGILRPNQYVRVRLKGAVRPGAILVPQRAVQQGSEGHFVWVVSREGKAELRPVVVGKWHGDDWFVNEGLHAGDQVIVDGTLALQAGAPLSVQPAAAAPPPAGERSPSDPGSAPAKAGG